MGYSRNDAIKYAEIHWNQPCDDGVFWLTDEAVNVAQKRKELGCPESEGWKCRFVPDGKVEAAVFVRDKPGSPDNMEYKVIQRWAGLADCAHYLSKCIQAGGLKSVFSLGVASLVSQLRARDDTKTLAETVPQDRAQRILDTGLFTKGDVIGYYNIAADGDYGGRQSYTHSTMYLGKDGDGKGRITCHTQARFGKLYRNDEWFLMPDHYKYTLIHFTADDPKPSAATTELLSGWWKVTRPGQTVFYYFWKNGTVGYTPVEPKSKTLPMVGPAGTAYWFEQGRRVLIFWRTTGSLDEWDVSPGTDALPIKMNGVSGQATWLGR